MEEQALEILNKADLKKAAVVGAFYGYVGALADYSGVSVERLLTDQTEMQRVVTEVMQQLSEVNLTFVIACTPREDQPELMKKLIQLAKSAE